MERTKALAFLSAGLRGEDLSDLCRDLGVSVGGCKDDKANRILHRVTGWDDLVSPMTISALKEAAWFYGLSTSGTKVELAKRLKEFIEQASVELLEDPPDPEEAEGTKNGATTGWTEGVVSQGEQASGTASKQKLDLNRENVCQVLQGIRLPRDPRDEYAAQREIFRELVERFGDDCVGREMIVGGYSFTRVDIDLDQGIFGIEVKDAQSLFNETCGHAHEVERLLGQLVLYRKRYKPENIFVVIAGNLKPEQKAALRELRGLVRDQGSEIFHAPVQ